jgi:hypothetical protein
MDIRDQIKQCGASLIAEVNYNEQLFNEMMNNNNIVPDEYIPYEDLKGITWGEFHAFSYDNAKQEALRYLDNNGPKNRNNEKLAINIAKQIALFKYKSVPREGRSLMSSSEIWVVYSVRASGVSAAAAAIASYTGDPVSSAISTVAACAASACYIPIALIDYVKTGVTFEEWGEKGRSLKESHSKCSQRGGVITQFTDPQYTMFVFDVNDFNYKLYNVLKANIVCCWCSLNNAVKIDDIINNEFKAVKFKNLSFNIHSQTKVPNNYKILGGRKTKVCKCKHSRRNKRKIKKKTRTARKRR